MFGEPILCFSSYASLPHNQGHQFSSPALRRRHCMSTLFCTPELLPVIPPNVLRYCHSGVLFLSKKLWTCFTQFILAASSCQLPYFSNVGEILSI